MNKPINLEDKLSLFEGLWSPKIIESLNDFHIKVAKIKGEFTWHDHKETDELFLVIKGQMVMEYEDAQFPLKSGDVFVVEKGKRHRPVAEEECHILLIEPAGTVNTGDETSELTASNSEWI